MSEDEPVETFKIDDDHELRIYQDTTPENPRISFDNIGHMVCFNSRYNLGDNHDIVEDDVNSGRGHEYLKTEHGAKVILPLYLYDHGGITISTTPFSSYWDTSFLGWIYATQEKIDELGEDWQTDEKVEEVLRGEIETYDQYLRGDVYGFRVVKLTKCKCCDHVSEEEEEAVWGYYGSDCAKNGVFDAAGYKPDKKEE